MLYLDRDIVMLLAGADRLDRELVEIFAGQCRASARQRGLVRAGGDLERKIALARGGERDCSGGGIQRRQRRGTAVEPPQTGGDEAGENRLVGARHLVLQCTERFFAFLRLGRRRKLGG